MIYKISNKVRVALLLASVLITLCLILPISARAGTDVGNPRIVIKDYPLDSLVLQSITSVAKFTETDSRN